MIQAILRQIGTLVTVENRSSSTEEGEVNESDEEFNASYEKSEEEEDDIRVTEVKKECERDLKGINATPSKLTRAQKKKNKKKKGSGRKAKASQGRGVGEGSC